MQGGRDPSSAQTLYIKTESGEKTAVSLPPSLRQRLDLFAPAVAFAALIGLGALIPRLSGILNLALPFFGMIGLGYFCGRLRGFPEAGLQWMNFFIVYIALPGLFFNLIAATPFAELHNWPYIFGTTISTYTVYAVSFAVGIAATKGNIKEASIQGVAGSYSNIGYMGPGLTLAALGPQSAVPTALIFVFDNAVLFAIVPFLMAIGGSDKMRVGETVWYVVKRIVTHPFNIATAAGVLAAYFQVQPPASVGKMLSFMQNAAAPCALFVMGVTVALRPIKRVGPEMPVLLFIKLIVHPLLVWCVLSLIGDFGREWTFTAVLMAALPPALNVFVMASQYQTYVERASSIILLGTIASVATVTALLYVIADGRVPYRLFGG